MIKKREVAPTLQLNFSSGPCRRRQLSMLKR